MIKNYYIGFKYRPYETISYKPIDVYFSSDKILSKEKLRLIKTELIKILDTDQEIEIVSIYNL